MPLNYNPTSSAHDNVGLNGGTTDQLSPFFYLRKAIVRARKLQFFMPLADTVTMPKNYGKTIKVYEYVPLLDDRNVNNQGVDASGLTMDGVKYTVIFPDTATIATNANKAAAVTAINVNLEGQVAVAGANDSGGAGYALITGLTKRELTFASAALATTVTNNVLGSYSKQTGGALYGSSRDIGRIVGRLPALTENGGAVNRVSFTRISREASLQKLGFYFVFTNESMQFDSDAELMDRLSTELMNAATQIAEAALQADLLNGAGAVVYAGAATSKLTLTGETTATAAQLGLVDYNDLIRLDQMLTDNRTPMQTTVITGSRYIDTKTVPQARIMFIGSELVPVLRGMKDLFNNAAFIPVHAYTDAGNVLNGEIGSIYNFRVVLVPEMMQFAGAGGVVTSNAGYRATGNRYDVSPMLVVGDDSFSTIGFQTDGKTVKFTTMTKMPGMETAHAATDPYGETGFSSIKWYYATLIKRPERIGIIFTIAPQ